MILRNKSHLRENDHDDETEKTNSLSANKDKDHSDVEVFVDGVRAHWVFSDNFDSVAWSEQGQSAAETTCKCLETLVGTVFARYYDLVDQDHTHNQTVDADNTRHDDWDERFLH